MNRAYSLLSIQAVDDDQRIIRGIATTPTTDRVGDVVEPEGAEFTLPLPLLWQHNSGMPIGYVTDAKVTSDGIQITAQIEREEEPGQLQQTLDYAWGCIKKGLVKGLSIGFKEIESARIEQTYSYRYLKWLWLELSAVTIPANGDCTIETIKSIDSKARAATGRERPVVKLIAPGASGTPNRTKPEEAEMKTIAEQIAALEAKRAANTARMTEVMQKSMEEGRSSDAAEQEEFDTLEKENDAIDADLKRLRSLEKATAGTAKPVTNVATAEDGTTARGGAATPVVVKGPTAPKGAGFVRLLAARFIAHENHISPADVAISRGWGKDIADVLRVPKDILIKAPVAAANTTDPSWAGPLVTYNNLQQEFIELLRPKTIIGRIPGLRQVPFNVKVPRETGETTGYWVGQGSPKPVSAGALDTVTLDFAKVAGITFLTQELLRFSQPSAETLMVNSLTKALIKLMDNDFLDPSKSAVVGVSPASITNGTSPITASGASADAFRADFADLLALYTMSNYSLDDLVIVMSQTQAMRLSLMRNDFGAREFPDINKDGGFIEGVPVVTSENVAANGGSPADGRIIVALAANSILLADDGGVEVDISTEASIQVDSAPDSPSTASTVLVSLWQNNLVGIRCERFVTWQKARSGAAVYITGGNYG